MIGSDSTGFTCCTFAFREIPLPILVELVEGLRFAKTKLRRDQSKPSSCTIWLPYVFAKAIDSRLTTARVEGTYFGLWIWTTWGTTCLGHKFAGATSWQWLFPPLCTYGAAAVIATSIAAGGIWDKWQKRIHSKTTNRNSVPGVWAVSLPKGSNKQTNTTKTQLNSSAKPNIQHLCEIIGFGNVVDSILLVCFRLFEGYRTQLESFLAFTMLAIN